ncbi:MAG: hypothetical protein BMS9Abin13_003 [Patescibacteria group bacterium]|nr:MAG: hypothetical protein BMS9Abin13_003 [Patescibacteria group bacterium]
MNEFKETQPTENLFLKKADCQELIDRRKIAPEDFQIIEDLSHYPTEFFVAELHNFFSSNQEKSAQAIKDRIKQVNETLEKYPDATITATASLKEAIPLLVLFLEFTEKYGWMAAGHLNSLLENR